ncbi:hypothetical protein EHEL_110470 [Encephalitozoon hellem ATCC 50504]|uniref:Ubiquitin carboxyl-terminal hydrolase 28 n=1 Tax=Encephalitozoon hellem TaxID=27973 RepID=A0A9Q9C5V9_ENCHE|nr:uncharacterized protein EHEL_110470 [Encephalitozoon hellem ATCC 50504]AFM99321.1 hypothetical protein EHEL_110470 [Encephalitozoon hellem ATCC 50504]UTX44325.1 ubiquitin carboxyl-terminal hydrolase 28 [Encephalitozoon hellem]|eukprot:XP_003888302.1 hypothetical protein EHEL_110470 [Encephalitozoon hellem ATCC 50504]
MKVKAESCVFFVNGMTAEQEYEIATRQLSKAQKKPMGRLNGSRLILSGRKAFEKRPMKAVDLEYVETDEKMFNLLSCLLRLPPFYNFILNLEERSQDIGKFHITGRISKLLSLVMEGKKENVNELLMEPDSKLYEDIYSELLLSIHQELCEWYNFEEDTWSTMDRTQGIKPKLLYKDYSPIVEMFQGKAVSRDMPQEISFEKSKISLKGFSSIQEAFDSSLKAENKKITKKPQILVLVVKDQESTDLFNNSKISIGNCMFSLCSFITEDGAMSYCYVKSGDKDWHGYESDGIRDVLEMKDVHGYPLMLFYARNE